MQRLPEGLACFLDSACSHMIFSQVSVVAGPVRAERAGQLYAGRTGGFMLLQKSPPSKQRSLRRDIA